MIKADIERKAKAALLAAGYTFGRAFRQGQRAGFYVIPSPERRDGTVYVRYSEHGYNGSPLADQGAQRAWAERYAEALRRDGFATDVAVWGRYGWCVRTTIPGKCDDGPGERQHTLHLDDAGGVVSGAPDFEGDPG